MRREARWSSYTSPEWTLFNMLFGGLFIILLGSLFYLASSGLAGDLVTWPNFWTYLLMGLGAMLLVRGVIEVFSRHSVGYGSIIGGMVLLTIGAAGVAMFLTGGIRYFWAAAIIASGLLVILVGLLIYLFRRQA